MDNEGDRYSLHVTHKRTGKTLEVVDNAIVAAYRDGCDIMNWRQYVYRDKWTKGREDKWTREVADMNARDRLKHGPCGESHPVTQGIMRDLYARG